MEARGLFFQRRLRPHRFRFPNPTWEARLGCPVGTYAVSVNTLSVQTECRLCSEGTFTSNQSIGLQFSSCSECPAGLGTLPGTHGSAMCDSCPCGRAQNGMADRGVCNKCPTGTLRMANDTNGQTCQLCPAGRYAAVRGRASCSPCPAQTFQSDRGQTN
jgi:hypothetical protein